MAVMVDSIIGKITEMMVDVVKDEVAMIFGVSEEMEKLKRTLEMINCVLEDAERRRLTDKVVEKWLQDLKDVVYDADDIFDLWKIKIDQKPAPPAPATVRPYHSCSSCFPFMSCCRNTARSHDIGNRIKGLNLKLEEISKNKDRYGLVDLGTTTVVVGGRFGQIGSSDTSPVMDLDIVGTQIEEDMQMLVKKLIELDIKSNTRVLAIVGIGGAGKTTLARKIFHHEEIKDVFELKMWVCVSQELKEVTLLRNIIKEAGGNPETEESRSRLEPKLVSALKGKRFLLVIDDVWDGGLWDRLLRNPLGVGAAGSRVIVTTRKDSVAGGILELIYTHNVNLMSREDGWSLLGRKVVLGGEEREIEHLKDVGLDIVRKCDGLSLAIATLGGILRTKEKTIWAWKSVLDDAAWSVSGLPNQLHRGLYLSYLDLPPELKQCFLFLSIFPEDYRLNMEYIVGVWISEGRVKVQGNSSLEMVGEKYYKELISRSLLQPDSYDNIELASRMHDLLRLLAQFLTQEDSLYTEEGNDQVLSPHQNFRHLSIASRNWTTIDDFLKKQKSLRTLMVGRAALKHFDGLFSHLSLLRILDLSSSIPECEELPDYLVSLVHLRFLDVSNTKITTLPDKLGNLKNLQFLFLCYCSSLHRLPKSVVELRNLRRLNLRGTNVEGIPIGIRRLENLRSLEGFVVQSNNSGVWSSLEEMQIFSHLMKLTIKNLERVPNCHVARAAAIGKKSHLTRLDLSCSISSSIEEEVKRVEEIFKELQPPPCIEVLYINGYPGSLSPSWISPSGPVLFTNLKKVYLYDWKYCKKLPALGRLPNLTDLYIQASSVEIIGSEFMDVSCSGGAERERMPISFPKLKKLGLYGMDSLKTWVWGEEVGALSCLQELTISDCLSLKAIPQGLQFHAISLTSLTLDRADSLESIRNLAHLAKLHVKSASLTEISEFPSLKALIVVDCPCLRVVKNLPALQTIHLFDYLKMGSIPNWLAGGEDSAKPSRVLEIHSTLDLLKKVCLREEGEEWPKIRHISRVNIYAEDRKLHAIYTKTPCSFTTNINDWTTNTSSD